MTPGQSLKALIKDMKMTQTKFAEAIGTKQGVIAQWIMRDSIPKEYLFKIHEVFPKVSISFLITGEGSMYNDEVNTPTHENELRVYCVGNGYLVTNDDKNFTVTNVMDELFKSIGMHVFEKLAKAFDRNSPTFGGVVEFDITPITKNPFDKS